MSSNRYSRRQQQVCENPLLPPIFLYAHTVTNGPVMPLGYVQLSPYFYFFLSPFSPLPPSLFLSLCMCVSNSAQCQRLHNGHKTTDLVGPLSLRLFGPLELLELLPASALPCSFNTLPPLVMVRKGYIYYVKMCIKGSRMHTRFHIVYILTQDQPSRLIHVRLFLSDIKKMQLSDFKI